MLGPVAILILAAGEGSRMGSIKQLLTIGKTNLIGAVLQNSLKAEADHIYCVLGAHGDVIRKNIQEFDVHIIVNDRWREGLGSSIAKGVRYIKEHAPDTEAILILLGDQPLVKPEYINEIISSYQKNPGCITASRYHGNLGVPAIFPRDWFDELMNLKGDQGARSLLNDAEQNIIFVQPEDNLKDIDTPEDYRQLAGNDQEL